MESDDVQDIPMFLLFIESLAKKFYGYHSKISSSFMPRLVLFDAFLLKHFLEMTYLAKYGAFGSVFQNSATENFVTLITPGRMGK